jgi:hypothetical protein
MNESEQSSDHLAAKHRDCVKEADPRLEIKGLVFWRKNLPNKTGFQQMRTKSPNLYTRSLTLLNDHPCL